MKKFNILIAILIGCLLGCSPADQIPCNNIKPGICSTGCGNKHCYVCMESVKD